VKTGNSIEFRTSPQSNVSSAVEGVVLRALKRVDNLSVLRRDVIFSKRLVAVSWSFGHGDAEMREMRDGDAG
jgi:hypothetical protein